MADSSLKTWVKTTFAKQHEKIQLVEDSNSSHKWQVLFAFDYEYKNCLDNASLLRLQTKLFLMNVVRLDEEHERMQNDDIIDSLRARCL